MCIQIVGPSVVILVLLHRIVNRAAHGPHYREFSWQALVSRTQPEPNESTGHTLILPWIIYGQEFLDVSLTSSRAVLNTDFELGAFTCLLHPFEQGPKHNILIALQHHLNYSHRSFRVMIYFCGHNSCNGAFSNIMQNINWDLKKDLVPRMSWSSPKVQNPIVLTLRAISEGP